MPSLHSTAVSPSAVRTNPPKSVCFELLLNETTKVKARIPLRVLVNIHDTTDSIIATVKSFYGIYDGHGIGFEDSVGSPIVAAYDNFVPNTTVYVRALPSQSQSAPATNGLPTVASIGNSPRKSALGEPFHALPPHMRDHSPSPTRGSSRLTSKASVSPSRGRGRRSTPNHHKNAAAASRGSSAHDSVRNGDFSDSDAGQSSVSGSKKARSEQYTADIDPSNIVPDGGRRGNANLFTAELLPLYTPNIVPVTASHDSNSPMRRPGAHEGPSPAQLPTAKLYDNMAPPLMSPSSYNNANNMNQYANNTFRSSNGAPAHDHRLRTRESTTSHGRSGVLPTPDPTVASCISDEDVARTLMALGNASSYGRTSTSTLDETFSAAADAASSTGASSEVEDDSEDDDEEPRAKYRRVFEDSDGSARHVTKIKSEHDSFSDAARSKKVKTKSHDGPAAQWKPSGIAVKKSSNKSRSLSSSKAKGNGAMKAPPVPNQVRKASSSSSVNGLAMLDDDDLSSKPRCQRCRKSKKGCDRQRPCGRCKDAGIGPEGCISEDEGNGRKGRYGRHMGVPLKKTSMDSLDDHDMSNTVLESVELTAQGSPGKKRKR